MKCVLRQKVSLDLTIGEQYLDGILHSGKKFCCMRLVDITLSHNATGANERAIFNMMEEATALSKCTYKMIQ